MTGEASRVRRIVVALDPSEQGRRAAATAAEVAARMQAELVGVFVEDIEILRMAGLPFAQEFRPYRAEGERVEAASIERELRGQATLLRQAMARAAENARVPWSFRVARGSVAQELLAAAQEADMIVVGRSATRSTHRMPIGSTARAVLAAGQRTIVVLHKETSLGRPVLVLFDGTPSSEHALALAATLAHQDHQQMVVALAPSTGADTKMLAERADAMLRGSGLAARHIVLGSADPVNLLAAVARERCRTLVLGVESDFLAACPPSDIVEQASCPVVLVH